MAMADQRSTPCAVRSRLVVGSCKQVPHRASIHRLYSPELSSHRIKAWERRQCGGFGYGGGRGRGGRGRGGGPRGFVGGEGGPMVVLGGVRPRGVVGLRGGGGGGGGGGVWGGPSPPA